MTEIIKETIKTRGDTDHQTMSPPMKTEASKTETIEYLIYFFFGLIEILLGFRLILKLTGASLASTFVRFIYGLTGVFTLPFDGIFRRGYSQITETTSIFEPSVIVAIVVYVFLAWGIVKLLRISSKEKQES